MKKLIFFYFFPVSQNMNTVKLTKKCLTAQKMKFSIKDFFSKCDEKLHFCALSL